jgi:hypothetical protein
LAIISATTRIERAMPTRFGMPSRKDEIKDRGGQVGLR